MSVRAELRRELERGGTAIDKVILHLQKAGEYAIAGGRPEIDDALMVVGVMLTSVKGTIDSVRDSM